MSYESVMQQARRAMERAGRDPADLTVVAVSKSQPAEAVARVYEAGHRDFGENRAQELAAKASELPSDIRWHFIGSLQTNKVRSVRPVVTLLQSMDRASLAQAWVKGVGLPPPALIQVDLAGEPQKGGASEIEVPELADLCAGLGIEVRGLMAIPPLADDPDDSRPWFRQLRRLAESMRDDHPQLTEISMGMTDDFEVAISEGATMIRVGRAIFGPRQ